MSFCRLIAVNFQVRCSSRFLCTFLELLKLAYSNMHLTHIAGILQKMPHMVQFMACLKCAFSHLSELNVVTFILAKFF
jgi:hypothetical protein